MAGIAKNNTEVLYICHNINFNNSSKTFKSVQNCKRRSGRQPPLELRLKISML